MVALSSGKVPGWACKNRPPRPRSSKLRRISARWCADELHTTTVERRLMHNRQRGILPKPQRLAIWDIHVHRPALVRVGRGTTTTTCKVIMDSGVRVKPIVL